MKNRVLLLILTLALLITCAVFTVSASGEETNTFEESFVCPCNCGLSFDEIEWRVWGSSSLTSPYSWSAADHYLVQSSLAPASEGTLTGVNGKIVVVFHKSDSSALTFGVTASDKTIRTLNVPADTTAYIVGDNATIWGRLADGTSSSANGGLIYVASGATLNVSGSVTMMEYTDTTNSPYRGGLVYNAGTVSMNGTVLDATNISMNSWGGAVYNAGTMTLTNCTVTGTTASKGGSFANTGTLGLTGCTVTGGQTIDTGSGGNFFINGGTTTLTSCTVSGGQATYGGNFYVYTGRLNIQDTATAKTVISDGVATTETDGKVPAGGNIYTYYKAATTTASALTGYLTVNMVHADSMISGGSATNGGNIYTAYSTTLTAGKITGGTATTGGTIYVNSGNTTVAGATVENGTATTGGVIYHKAGSLNLKAGNITGKAVGENETATVTNGGTIYVNGGTFNMGTDSNYAGPVITGTKVTDSGYGGALYINAGTITLDKGTITGGEAKYGGCIYTKKNVTVGEVTISNGAAYRGGCVYVPSGVTYTMNGGSISGGVSTNQGGQVFLGGTFNMTSGTVTANPNSTGPAPGFRVQDGVLDLSGDAVVISAGASNTDAIDVVSYNKSAGISLAGSATVKNKDGETDGDNIINIQNIKGSDGSTRYPGKLTVYEGWTGTARVYYEYLFGSSNKTADYTVGMTIGSDYGASTGDYSGTLLMEGAANNPPLYAGDNGTLQVAQVQLCTYNLPKLDAQWFKSGTEAATAAQDGDYISIYTAGTMDIGDKAVLVDFNGNDCTVTGTGKLYIMDAAGDSFDGTLAKITYDNVATNAQNPYNDRQYIALSNGDGTYSAHRIDLCISAVSVRPGSAGVYYTASLNCDSTLRDAFNAAGVAVSLDSIPGEDFADNTLYTKITQLEEDEFTGVLINEILKSSEATNDTRGKQTIYANAYATFTVDGASVTVLADTYNGGLTKGSFLPGHTYTAYSLYDVMNAIDLRWRSLSETAQTSVLEKLYNGYDNVMHDWNLQYMIGQVKDLKVLTIGNSLSVDAGHMLGYIAQLEGMENIHFSTLYYGGCTLRQHANFLTDNSPEYRWYDTEVADLQNATAADTVPEVSLAKKDQITMYQGIIADDWDIIVMQQGVWESGKPETHEEDMDTVINYVRKHATNPNVVLMWNMIWAPPVESEMLDRSNNGIAPDASGFEASYDAITGTEARDNKEAQNIMFGLIRNAVQTKVLTNDNFLDVIPAGTAQQNGLWSGLTDEDLYRDYIHASDLARYIYSYMWYCKLTDSDFDGVASATVPLAVRYIKKDDISEIPAATTDMDLTETVEGYDYSLLDVVNHSISSALENPFTPKGIND